LQGVASAVSRNNTAAFTVAPILADNDFAAGHAARFPYILSNSIFACSGTWNECGTIRALSAIRKTPYPSPAQRTA
jgi:hypothetical protein